MVNLWAAPPEEGVNAGDYAGAFFKVGFSELLAAVPAGARYLVDQIPEGEQSDFTKFISAGSDYLRRRVNQFGEDSLNSLSPDAQKQLNAAITSPEFWESPFSATALKLTRMSPSVLAAVAAAMVAPEGIPAMLSMGAMGGGLSASQTLNDIYSQVEGLTDEELMRSPLYRGMRESGLTEGEARAQLQETMIGAKPAMLFALGALTSVAGPPGQIARGLGIGGERALTQATGSLTRRAASGFAVGGASEAVQSGAEQYTTEQSMVDAGLQDQVNWGAVGSVALEGGALGGVMGGAIDAVTGRNPARERKRAPVESTPPTGPDQAQTVAISARTAPTPPPAAEATPAAQPTPDQPSAPTAATTPAPADQTAPSDVPASTAAQPKPPAAETTPAAEPTPAQPAAAVPPKVTPAVKPAKQRAAARKAPSKVSVDQATGARVFNVTPTEDAAAVKANAARIKKNIAAGEQKDAGPQPGHRSNEQNAERARQGEAAKKIFESSVPEKDVVPSNTAERQSLKDRLQGILDKADAESISWIKNRNVNYDSTPDHIVWLKEVQDLRKAFNKKDGPTTEHMQEFLVREQTARGGDFTEMRAARRAAGELASRADQGDSGEMADTGTNSWSEEEAAVKEAEADGVGVGAGEASILTGDSAEAAPAAQQENVVAEGEDAGDQAELSDIADATPDERIIGNDDVTTKTSKSAKRSVNTFDESRAAYDKEQSNWEKDSGAASRPELKAQYENAGTISEAAREWRRKNPDKVAKITGAKTDKVRARVAEKAVEKATGAGKAKKSAPKGEAVKKVAAERAAAKKAATPKKEVTPKVKSAQERVKAAAAETNKTPTEAQKKAGNYKKGTVNLEGIELKFETPKGATRSGTAPDGTTWSVKMRDHYGYVRNTEGVDGDPVDVFIGPKIDTSDFVLVIDQVDPDTKAFDEHKAMMGFANVAAAQKAYVAAFSDGRGADRVGDFAIMSIDEFKAWLKDHKATKKPAGAPNEVTQELGVPSEVTPATIAQVAEGGRTIENTSNWRSLMESGTVEMADDLSSLVLTAEGDKELKRLKELGYLDEDIDAILNGEDVELDEPAMVGGSGVDTAPMADPVDWHGRLDAEEGMHRRSPFVGDLSRNTVDAAKRSYDKAKASASLITSAAKAMAAVRKDLPNVARVLSNDQKTIKVLSKVAANLPRFSERVEKSLGNAELFIIPDAVFYGEDGLNYPQNYQGLYSGVGHYIMIPERVTQDRTNFARVLLHEATHAAFMNKMWSDPDVLNNVRWLYDEAKMSAKRRGLTFYGLTNVDEFIAEAFSNPNFQAFLATTNASSQAKKFFGLDGSITSVWDMIVASVKKALGLGKEHDTILNAVMKIAPTLEEPGGSGGLSGKALANKVYSASVESAFVNVKESIDHLTESFTGQGLQDQQRAPAMLRLQTFDQIARIADRYFGGNRANPVRKIADLVGRMAVRKQEIIKESEPLITRLHALEKKHTASGAWGTFTKLMNDMTMARVYLHIPLEQQKHLGKDALAGKWSKARYAELKPIYDALPADLKAAHLEAMKFFTDKQNAMSLKNLRNRVRLSQGRADEDLVQRIRNGTTTKADEAAIGAHELEILQESAAYAKIKGPYFPLMRRGDWVVSAKVTVRPPSGALRQIDDTTWEFSGPKARDKAIAFAEGQGDLTPTIRSVWVDKATGERFGVDTDGKEVRITQKDINAEQRFRVTVQNRHVDSFPTQREARRAAAELSAHGLDVFGVQEVRNYPGGNRADMLSSQIDAMVTGMKRRGNWDKLSSTQQNEMEQAFRIEAIRILGATRIQSRRLPRTNVLGASRDFLKNTIEYAQSAAGYEAKLEIQPDLDAALKKMDEAVSDNNYGKNKSLARSVIANEVRQRVVNNSGVQEGGRFSPAVNRVLTLSFIDKLASASYSIVNSTQPALLTTPVLAGRYGPGRAFRAMSKAYNDVSAATVGRKGLEDTLAKMKSIDAEGNDLMAIATRKLSADEKRMVRELVETGVIDPQAGFEVDKFTQASTGLVSKGDTALRYLEGIARQLPKAVETVNRTASAVAAYRLELERTGNHDTAAQYAKDIVNSTQFNYANTNAAPIFNHPLMRIPLQFKKYGQGMYALMGHQIGKAIRNENPGDRAEAIKSLAYITAAHMVVAGTLGLPTEPFKVMLMSANVLGLTGLSWSDVEETEREIAASVFGPGLGEMVTRGATRGIGIDISSRIGLDNLMIFGEPRSDKDADVKSYLFDLFGGAPTALVMNDWVPGMNALMEGDLGEAAEKLIPVKTMSDAIKAYRTASEGKKSSTGRDTMSPYSLGEAAIRTIGFTPSRESENRERATAFMNASRRQTDERTELLSNWATGTGADKARAWIEIQKWNRKRDAAAQITMSELTAYARRRRTYDAGRVEGINPTTRDRQTYKKVESIYNYQ